MKEEKKSLFERLSAIDVSKYVEKKNDLTYLSWAPAWRIFKEQAPDANYEILKFNGLPFVEHETGIMCYTRVTAEGETHEMWLPVMDYRNQALKVDKATMFDVNKTIMRCLVKNLAMFGLGLYIYAGEDLPEEPKPEPKLTDGEKAAIALSEDPTLKWSEVVYPGSKKAYKGKSLSFVAANGGTDALEAMGKAIAPYADKYPLADKHIKAAILESKNHPTA